MKYINDIMKANDTPPKALLVCCSILYGNKDEDSLMLYPMQMDYEKALASANELKEEYKYVKVLADIVGEWKDEYETLSTTTVYEYNKPKVAQK